MKQKLKAKKEENIELIYKGFNLEELNSILISNKLNKSDIITIKRLITQIFIIDLATNIVIIGIGLYILDRIY